MALMMIAMIPQADMPSPLLDGNAFPVAEMINRNLEYIIITQLRK